MALFCILSIGCRSQKDTTLNRGLQNLTTRYNILYNANLLLEESLLTIENTYYDDFSQILPIYKDPSEREAPSVAPIIDSAIKKANTIVNEKTQSKYIDDAYYLIAKANYLKANFYDASEFFSYVIKTYPAEKELKLSSLAWKTRALIQLNYLEEAGATIDSALKYLDSSSKQATEVYTSYAQLLIRTGKAPQALEVLGKALDTNPPKKYRIRWTYILAQLQEANNQRDDAFLNYSRIAKSNASFEMAFNAELNRVRMRDEEGNRKNDKIASLRSMLKSDKYLDFSDQIYYRIGDVYLERQQLSEAIMSYQKATKQNTKSQVHKGLSYLKLAEIYFRTGNYTKAKSYYDTTLNTLPPTFHGYDQIRRKSGNLELLADRFRIIAKEDTLQALARMNEADREERIGQLVREQAQKTINESGSPVNPDAFIAAIDNPNIRQKEGKFYFNNSTAISQGFSDFQRKWGSRPPADNWRRSNKTASDVTETVQNQSGTGTLTQNQTPSSPDERRKAYIAEVPLSPQALRLSNERIAAAYYDIAGFYRDEMKDKDEAIRTFQELLKRVPESSYTPAVYYNLYLLYAQTNRQQSDVYRDMLLKQYPETAYAKTVLNPRYGREADEKEAAINQTYNSVYLLYTSRKYPQVIDEISKAERLFGKNKLSPQFAYLKALAAGHIQKLPPFETALQALADTFATDQLIAPIVRQHLEYISSHREEMNSRPTALLEYDPMNIFMEPEPVQSFAANEKRPLTTSPANKPSETVPAGQGQKVETPTTDTAPVKTTTEPKAALPPAMYSLPDSAEYYFVVNVLSPGVNLSPSRFGIGQFNRSKFAGSSIKHQLKTVNNENQLIFVGPFFSRKDVTNYERSILPLINDIMKIASERYNTFVISKRELEKLNTRAMINSYMEFYKNYK
ncbi:tetratricopeptide repeat protein [Arcticibacter tournemirensis]|uniref:Tetratricopeptide repeat protein n=2 Tax=Arcticibacter tournemirensis TaxID=699437 RepID=A0A5M9H192_9SPHI|nr:tetratricopeptide repeat protein [Arcticibacter tournemirensis]KAA8478884.1 tetratricopeptide repeat protein [Arcticibacter tournemirensis]